MVAAEDGYTAGVEVLKNYVCKDGEFLCIGL